MEKTPPAVPILPALRGTCEVAGGGCTLCACVGGVLGLPPGHICLLRGWWAWAGVAGPVLYVLMCVTLNLSLHFAEPTPSPQICGICVLEACPWEGP